MAQLGRDSNQPRAERYYVEYVEVSTDEGATNKALRKAIAEKQRWGWTLATMTRAPSGGSVELVWDKS